MTVDIEAAVAIACAGAFLAFLDTTIVNIAFPDISASFAGSGRDALSWVLDGYFVVIAALLVPAGGLADRFGHKRIFLLGVGGFTAASLLCAVAPSLELLIAFRVLQGVGAALIAPTSLALVLDAFPVERRAAGVGLWGAAAAAAAAIGPTLGGALVELSDWRLVFLVNLPLGAAIVCAGSRRLRERPQRDSRLPDLPGALMLALGLALVTLGIVEGNDWGWTAAATLGSLRRRRASCSPAWSRAAARHPRPIVEPALFAHRSFRIGNLGTLLFAAAFFSLILGNVVFLTSIWGYTVLQAGAATLPGPGLVDVVSGPAGKLADRFGHRAVIVPGTLFFAAGVMVLRSAGAEPDWLGLWLPGATADRHRHRPRLPDPRLGRRPRRRRSTASPPPAPSTPPSARSAPCSAPRSSSPSSATRPRSPTPSRSPTAPTSSPRSPPCSRAPSP